MYKFQKRNKINKIVYSWPLIILALFLFFWMGKNVFNVYQGERLSQKNRAGAEAVYQALEEKHESMNAEIQLLKTEKGIEREIRDKFRVVKEGEQLAIIINSKGDEKAEKIEIETETIWTKIWMLFK